MLQTEPGLPPPMLDSDEMEAMVLGSQWVVAHADPTLARAALACLGKLAAIVPEGMRGAIPDPVVATPPARRRPDDGRVDMGRMRSWCRQGRKPFIGCVDETGTASRRTVWPFLVGYAENARTLMAWCELRKDSRIFRTDRLTSVEFLDECYPESRTVLGSRWIEMMDERGAQRTKGSFDAQGN